MLRKSWHLACAAYGSSGDDSHRVIANHHHELTNPRTWELSTPSRALPVLGVLADSGVFVEGLAQAAEPSLRTMAPCLTNAEMSMLGRVASFFSPSRPGPACSSIASSSTSPPDGASIVKHHGSPNELVRGFYAEMMKHEGPSFTIPNAMTADAFLQSLSLIEAAMLLELFVCSMGRTGTAPPHEVGKLVRILTSLLNAQTGLQFDVVLSVLRSTRDCVGKARDFKKHDTEDDEGVVPGDALASLSASCVRHVHQHLPDATMQQHVTLYLLLLTSVKEKPFIVLKAMEDHMLAHVEDFGRVRTPTLLALMSTAFGRQHAGFTTRLSLLWYYGDRATDMTPKESLLALYILVHVHVLGGGDELGHGVTVEEWQLVHDYLFAQLFSFMRHFSLKQCVAIFDALEIMNASRCSIHVPPAFAEKVKKRSFAVASGIAKRGKSTDEVDQALEAFLHLKAALQRCGVLPFSEADEKLCQAVEGALHQTALLQLNVNCNTPPSAH